MFIVVINYKIACLWFVVITQQIFSHYWKSLFRSKEKPFSIWGKTNEKYIMESPRHDLFWTVNCSNVILVSQNLFSLLMAKIAPTLVQLTIFIYSVIFITIMIFNDSYFDHINFQKTVLWQKIETIV